MNQQELDYIEREVASILKTGNIPYLLDYIESEFQYLLEAIPEVGLILNKRHFSQIEQVLKNSNQPLTEEQKQEVTKIVSTVTFMHGMYFGFN